MVAERFTLGLDDTDTLDGGCTTHVFDAVLHALASHPKGWRLEGSRWLVRLWPHAPGRTRGNAALAQVVRLEPGVRPLLEARLDDLARELIDPAMARLHEAPSAPGHPAAPHLAGGRRPWTPARPGMVLTATPPTWWYWSAVRGPVDLASRVADALRSGATLWGARGAEGLIGALAAAAWSPLVAPTWELVAWRRAGRIGLPRRVPHALVREVEARHPGLLLSRDPTVDRGLIAPRGPCPVLWGLRAHDPRTVMDAHAHLLTSEQVEQVDGAALHLTNQASGDHLRPTEQGVVAESPVVGRRGHTRLGVQCAGGREERLLAFREGGDVNRLARSVARGDHVAWRGLRAPDGTIHLERLKVVGAVARRTGRPRCPLCDNRLASMGREQGLRCTRCRHRTGSGWLTRTWHAPVVLGWAGWVEPSPGQRRHLARALPPSPGSLVAGPLPTAAASIATSAHTIRQP